MQKTIEISVMQGTPYQIIDSRLRIYTMGAKEVNVILP
jgi:hypothetical protein